MTTTYYNDFKSPIILKAWSKIIMFYSKIICRSINFGVGSFSYFFFFSKTMESPKKIVWYNNLLILNLIQYLFSSRNYYTNTKKKTVTHFHVMSTFNNFALASETLLYLVSFSFLSALKHEKFSVFTLHYIQKKANTRRL